MAVQISGGGNITGLATGGITDGTITQSELAGNVAGTGPCFSAYQGSVQSVVNTTFTIMTCNTLEFDTGSMYDATTNYRYTPTVAGYYLITGSVSWGATLTTSIASIFKNGAEFKRGSTQNSGYQNIVSAIIFMNGSTDYVDLRGYQGQGTTQNTFAGAAYTYFQGCLIRATGTVSAPSYIATALNGPAFSYTQSVSQGLTSGVTTKITFTTAEFDTNTNFASSRFTPTVAGYYQINASIYFTSTAAITAATTHIYKNGSPYKRGSTLLATFGTVVEQSANALVFLNGSTDYVEIFGDATSSGTITTNATSVGTYVQGTLTRLP